MDELLHALGTPRRREILRLVWRAERSAGEIHRSMEDVTFGAVSQHLRVLERAGLVRARREGRARLYAAQPEGVGPLKAWLESMWGEALYGLKLRAELEEARRGPRPRRRQTRGRGQRTPAPCREEAPLGTLAQARRPGRLAGAGPLRRSAGAGPPGHSEGASEPGRRGRR
jgi:DNA-binding transcriptional ArsR family regulator